jgi:MFS family permease
MLGFWNAAVPLGSALGIVAGGLIADRFGWRNAFAIVALPSLLLGILFFSVSDYRTVALTPAAGGAQIGGDARAWLTGLAGHFRGNRTLLFNNLGFAANTFVTTALLTWLPTYFHRIDGTPMTEAGTRAASVMLLAVVGAPLGGFVADRWRERRADARLRLAAVSSAATAALLLVAFAFVEGSAQFAFLLAAGVTAVAFAPAAIAVTQDVVHPGLRATSMSLCVLTQHAFGSALGPPFVGALSDRWSLEVAMAWLPAFTLLGALLFFVGSFFYETDVAKIERVTLTAEG